ncbi:uncharacterized protein LOC131890189 [Tigriopus californicus]|uniref:uncharacterized protein LOC131890189 n=1 Tax=Tigriopus californicus TaxID=6832 RepID=UPI0027DA2B9A|nr:uncharacterized protein LOC131890189 [Tigriopus californicus]XP_059095475.1 uncharacterized protein LOC131890189 [Tigriopus californicus]
MNAIPASGSKLRIRLDLTAFDLAWKRVWMLVDCERTQNIGQLIQEITGKYFESTQPNLKLCLDDPYEIPEFEDIQVIRDGDLLAVSEQCDLMPPKKKRKKRHSTDNDANHEMSLFSTTKKSQSTLTTDYDDNPELVKTSRKKKTNSIPVEMPNHEQTGQQDAPEEVAEPVVKATRKRKRRPKNRNSINTKQEAGDAADVSPPLNEVVVNVPSHRDPVSVIQPIQPVKVLPEVPPLTVVESFEPSSKKISCDQVLLG